MCTSKPKAQEVPVVVPPPAPVTEADKTSQKAIKRAIRELSDAGALTLQTPAARGRMAVYRVHPDDFTKDSTCG